MQDPSTFTATTILSSNPAQKRITLLGTSTQPVPSCTSPQAILIVSAKLPSPELVFSDVKKVFHNDIYTRFDVTMAGQYEIQAIYPVTDKHIKKYQQKKMICTTETAEEYHQGEPLLLAKQLKHLGWVHNILNGTAEADRVLFRCPDFVILPDFKFSDMSDTASLHLLAIFTDKSLHSLRDLHSSHIGQLLACKKEAQKILEERFKLEKNSCRMFFHYPPTFYQLHLHITNLRCFAANALVERAHLLENVVSCLMADPHFYRQRELVKLVEIDQ